MRGKNKSRIEGGRERRIRQDNEDEEKFDKAGRIRTRKWSEKKKGEERDIALPENY